MLKLRSWVVIFLVLMLFSIAVADDGAENTLSEDDISSVQTLRTKTEDRFTRRMDLSMSMSMNYYQTHSMAYSMSMSYSYKYHSVDGQPQTYRGEKHRRIQKNSGGRRRKRLTLTKSGQERIEKLVKDLVDPAFWQEG